jgi:UDP-N-acetyl-2-amino-2-deoxyglucuronate dehydrogenase
MNFPLVTDRKVRFALVGCGRISTNHFGSVKEHAADAELVDVCDIDSAAAQKAATETGAKAHTSLDAMLAATTADVVILTTPSGLHPRQAIAAAAAGKHVLTEKPMATNLDDAKAMIRACDDANRCLFVVKQNRRNATLQLLKKAIEAGRFGKIYMVTSNVFWTRPQSYYDQGGWRGTWEWDGGAFMNQASHYVDLLTWLVGPLDSVHAFTATHARKIEAEDGGVVNLKWRNGALGSMSVTMLTYPKNFEGSFTILGEKGTVRIGGVAVNEIQHWEFEDKQAADEEIRQASYATTSVYGFGHPMYYRNVIDTLRGKSKPETDGREGYRSLQTLIAIYKSAREGAVVGLPLGRNE